MGVQVEQVRKELAGGQQVYRRSRIEALLREIDEEYVPRNKKGDCKDEIETVRAELERSQKINRNYAMILKRVQTAVGDLHINIT